MNEDYRDILEALVAEHARFLIVGAHALALHGYPRSTVDIDIWIDASEDNAQRVWKALAEFGAPLEDLSVRVQDLTRPDVVIQCTNPTAGCTAGQVLPLPASISATSPLPAGFTAVVNTPGGGASRNVRRPNVTGEPFYIDNDRFILNPAAFSIPAPGEFGNLPRNALRGPIFRQFDLIVNKHFRITETVNLQFRTEIFNIFNTTNFANPAATLNNALSSSFQPGQPFTQSLAGTTFGQLRQTVERTVGLGTNRQIQFALRLNF